MEHAYVAGANSLAATASDVLLAIRPFHLNHPPTQPPTHLLLVFLNLSHQAVDFGRFSQQSVVQRAALGTQKGVLPASSPGAAAADVVTASFTKPAFRRRP